MARLVRATRELRVAGFAAAPWAESFTAPVIMGRPDKPGDDGQILDDQVANLDRGEQSAAFKGCLALLR
jgi:hypothetical protein